MDEHLALYPQAPSWTSRWCATGRHWKETAGDERVWTSRRCPDCNNARQKERYASDPEVRAAEIAKAGERHREYIRTPEGRAATRRAKRNRRARKRNAICQHGPGCFAAAAEQMPQRCAVKGCRKRKDIEADHIVPIANGGPDCRWNLQPLCGSHNASKQASDPVDWQLRHGLPAGVQMAM